MRQVIRGWSRPKRLAALVTGLLVVFAGVAFALVSISIDAQFTSNEFTPPPVEGEGLEIAVLQPGSAGTVDECGVGNAPYTTEAASFAPGAIDLNHPGGSSWFDFQSTGHFLCFKNVGPGTLTPFLALSATSGEAGCSPAEAAVDPDGTDCGATGDFDTTNLGNGLSNDLGLGTFGGTSTTDCQPLGAETGSYGVFVPPGGTADLQPIEEGQVCVYEIRLSFFGTDDEMLAASTDTINYLMNWTTTTP